MELSVGTFEWALSRMKSGAKVMRRSWNGKGIFAALQPVESGDSMDFPYLYFDNSGLSNNPTGFRGRIPWIPSQSDLLMDDWEEFV